VEFPKVIVAKKAVAKKKAAWSAIGRRGGLRPVQTESPS